MIIIADENIDNKIIQEIEKLKIKVISIAKIYSGISDKEVINISKINNPSIILTEDKDFGELIFAHKIKNLSIIFLRYKYSETQKIIKILQKLITEELHNLVGKYTTITSTKIRIRKI